MTENLDFSSDISAFASVITDSEMWCLWFKGLITLDVC